jgi:hypothetical protein
MRLTTLTLLGLFLAAPLFTACDAEQDEAAAEDSDGDKKKKKKKKAAASAAAAEDEKPADPWQAEIAAIKKAHAEAMATRKTRVVVGESLGLGEENGERGFRFKLTNTGSSAIDWAQTWVYYFDENGKCVDRYPHSIGGNLAPGAALERILGATGDGLAKMQKNGAKTAEVEITAVKWADGTRWQNENLVVPSWERKPGGETHEQLLAREGEKIVGKWLGTHGKDEKPVFKLTNITEQPVTLRTLWIYYYDDKGTVVDRDVENLDLTILPGATIEHASGSPKAEIEATVKFIEPSASGVTIGDKKWENENLSAFDRPMRGGKDKS